ncbi:MAG: bifunctional oligoribonuclease/PAP phosphatase NrnA [Clostridiales bacterium]|nr:bifunctional oligoribonuclease/PAP phosphatase NrnA [Clostridiales bacterium]
MLKTIKSLIDTSKTVAIFFHINPDGDAVGSSLALKFGLEQMGKTVTVFSSDEISDELDFLNYRSIKIHTTNEKFDLAIVLDCPDIKRIGSMIDVYKNCKKTLNIDHHLNNMHFADVTLVDPKASSTCEILYFLLKDLGVKFNKDISKSLYTGLATDSGCFMYNITKSLHSIAELLIENIDNVEQINYKLFREKKKEDLALYAEAISRLEYYYNNKFAITYVTTKDFEKLQTTDESTPGLIFLLSGLKDIDILCVMCEEPGAKYKVAFRSNTTNVCNFASLFGGGGHKFASGCKIYGTKNTVKKKILEKAREFLCTE